MSAERLQVLTALRDDLPAFAAACLQVLDTEGRLVPLHLNAVQRYVHAKLEAQLAEKGWVRAMVLKGRRPGVSTYVAARFYHKASMRLGRNVYILTHEQPASDILFSIVDRFQRHNPIAPHVGTANIRELIFDGLDSSYGVATAGQKASGRSRTTQHYHGSEVAFWANATDHFASSIQTVSMVPGTEIVLESTANGVSGEFFERWQKAEAGTGDYIAIFVPWFMDPGNARPVSGRFELAGDAVDGQFSEQEYAETYSLSNAQMEWRRGKIGELGSETMFRQEYPATSQEAFVQAGHDAFIPAVLVMRARKRVVEAQGPLILGVDPAGSGGDRFAVAARRGQAVVWIKSRSKIDAQEGIAWIRALIDEHSPARVAIDAAGGGNGAAIVSGLKQLGPKYAEVVRGVNFGGTAEVKLASPHRPGPANRRAEMWQRMKNWFEDPIGASLPDEKDLVSDISAPKAKAKQNGDFSLESKIDMKARRIRSPDLGDAVALTFAFNEYHAKYVEPGKVILPEESFARRGPVFERARGPGSWMI